MKPFSSTPPWTDLVAWLVFATAIGASLVWFLLQQRGGHRYRDHEIERRGSTWLVGEPLRMYFAWIMVPAAKWIARRGLPASAITYLSVLLALASGLCAAGGELGLAGWLYAAAGLCDFFDGRVARANGSASSRGALLDSVLDRYVEAIVLTGLAWHYRSSWVMVICLAALVGSVLVSYVRARTESLGIRQERVGVLQRTERIVLLAVALGLAPVADWALRKPPGWPDGVLVVAALSVLASGTHWTALSRLAHGLVSLGATRRRPVGPGSVMRSAVSSSLATAFDFVSVLLIVQWSVLSPAVATAIGCAFGGIVNYTLNRTWAYQIGGRYVPQMSRYAATSATGALLNAGGVALLGALIAADYRIGWWIVRGAVFLLWSHPLQRDWVFAGSERIPTEPPANEAELRGSYLVESRGTRG